MGKVSPLLRSIGIWTFVAESTGPGKFWSLASQGGLWIACVLTS